ncbi:MAG: DUF2271 domain-containing protein, partial [Deltaproteobacteria bacterium]
MLGFDRVRRLFSIVLAVTALPTAAAAQETLRVSFDTTPAGGNYAPKNVLAVWIEDSGGNFVRTIGRWADRRIDHLVAWSAASGQDVDAVSGATRVDHSQRIEVTWDMVDFNGMPVPNGTYTIRMELADRNSTSPDQNNQGTFTFVRDGQPSTQNVAGGGFENVVIDYTGVDTALCGNGTLDEGETCDPIDSCPTTCPDSGDECMVNTLVGSADTCTAECVAMPADDCPG